MTSAVLFDIDGTLIDSTYLHASAWRRAALELGFNVPTARIHRCIGMGSDMLMRELFGEQSDEVAAALEDAHSRHFDSLKDQLRAFDGAIELLDAVRARGARVVLATSAGAAELPSLLKVLGGDAHVDAVTGGISAEELLAAGAAAVYADVGELLRGLDASPLVTLWTP